MGPLDNSGINVNWAAANFATNFINSAAIRTSTASGTTELGGPYVLFRMNTSTAIMPTQEITAISSDVIGETAKTAKIAALTDATTRSLYQVEKAKIGTWQTVGAVDETGTIDTTRVFTARNLNTGAIMGGC